jgi:hypothetical protein
MSKGRFRDLFTMDRDRNFPPHPSGVREPIFPANFWHQRHYVPCRHHLLRTWNERFPHTSARRPERNRILPDVLTCPLSRGTCWAAEIDAFRYGRPKRRRRRFWPGSILETISPPKSAASSSCSALTPSLLSGGSVCHGFTRRKSFPCAFRAPANALSTSANWIFNNGYQDRGSRPP